MKDVNGLYYYPNPTEKSVRVYVRDGEKGPEFRLWHDSNSDMWERHGWIPYEVLQAAAAMYKDRGADTNPLELYDINVAKTLLRDAARFDKQ